MSTTGLEQSAYAEELTRARYARVVLLDAENGEILAYMSHVGRVRPGDAVTFLIPKDGETRPLFSVGSGSESIQELRRRAEEGDDIR